MISSRRIVLPQPCFDREGSRKLAGGIFETSMIIFFVPDFPQVGVLIKGLGHSYLLGASGESCILIQICISG